MKKVTVRELKAHWSEIEKQVQSGETFEVLNHGKPTAKIVQCEGQKVFKWPDHLATAIRCKGKTSAEIIRQDRDSRV